MDEQHESGTHSGSQAGFVTWVQDRAHAAWQAIKQLFRPPPSRPRSVRNSTRADGRPGSADTEREAEPSTPELVQPPVGPVSPDRAAVLDALQGQRGNGELRKQPIKPKPARSPWEDTFRPSEAARKAAAAIGVEVAVVVADEVGTDLGAQEPEPFVVHFHPPERRTRAVRGPKRAAEKGLAITRFDRLPIDGRVFDRKRSGGSVLIDNSGSMALSYEAVAAAIERFPALTIGRYSGELHGATLCVLAERGQLGSLGDCQVGGGGNAIDIESLAWLSKQPEPRIWVSDGLVCGGLVAMLGPDQAHALITSLCQRKGIVRVNTFEEAVHVLRRGPSRDIAVHPRDPDFLPLLDLGI